MSLGSSFVKGQTASKSLRVAYKIGLLHTIVLKAGGADGWNPVNFINVATPNGNQVQFATDYFLSNHITKSTSAAKQCYGVKFRTSTVLNSDSHSAMFVQLIGSKGRTNFLSLGNHFHRGATKVVNVCTNNHVGLLNEISVEAGGHDAWHPIGYITVLTPSKQN